MPKTMSQKTARESFSTPGVFEGGAWITKNGVAELYVQTAAERQLEEAEKMRERQNNALLKLIMKAKQEAASGATFSPDEALAKLRQSRK
ncbi:hypothetical protein [Cedecea neteri]|uniref:Prevent-host-death protein n=1 Tax=Cedecea neteri TaxID=158822 RepID=A0A291E4J5_9ENTR|nr:hypothetical protein [Cedecea neteri]ATF94994.1 hypothetical protein CO704_24400 [Cedecea neteri]